MKELTHFINGAQVKGTSGDFGDVYNPATGEVQAKLPLANPAEVSKAVEDAAEAQIAWGATNPQKRARVMMKMVALMNRDMDVLAEALSREHGKTIPDAKGDLQRGLEVIEYCVGAPQMLKGEYTDDAGPGIDMYSMRQPLGVVASIMPFNFPAMMPLWHVGPALACGNAVVLKPSERDPSVPLMLAELFVEAGLPKGVFQVVNGTKEAVDTLLDHEIIQGVSFVGSTPIAQYIYSRATANGKRAQCFGGAKNHLIVMPDADMDQAADALIGAGFGAAGERCMAVSVAVPVGEETADRLISALVPRIEKLRVAPYTDGDDVDFGPVVTREAKERILGLIQSGVDQGAELVVDNRDFKLQGYENGFFVGPHLFDRVTPDMDIYKQEIFGPVLSTVRAGSYEEALKLAMDHEYGNGTAIFTRDGDTARDFAHRVNIGMVGINVPIPVPLAYHTFGGWKKSMFGDLNQHGPDSFKFYTRTKTITTRWPSGIKEGGEFNFKAMD
ncbi:MULTISPECIES: CoA-acylating methylmalonate-semialdehyde dehydrogenase [Marivita]|jgi:malonate-semialdehyde dehydrogenase (acetylating)/methylmalonate-semialdehyde dehydrogenase|uniref:methylmalonate-semialdehyde dehydrogenase (CoA acylating) n=1 Tax=Marivita cryptomonadis TaxID=505252 RepID=A0A9Q2NQG6_9RHOB|nr:MULTISPECIES: CoA-acylating methylmalonate-semialdehyde dehydrogenase [Marivita]MCR9170401.1 CoA-acylating methylmalonate-semialdehyde dehydrogenase [Paracoccaceae bacterium]MBM2320691.1 CoA-acylating methylmalonate-semialdehyde dehydrogenase [Marivita cryptomonadis]MBM2330271.1 CoA-acylating methylmalonate-semialdehyde dehydrogenase [Marivita cryptomonadis]MBM2339858.1 CoA-acylating methylmalonate-semialdehyde dehydrogenase [Marivita cryptomonadis]MBM2344517.1 CoA-acylating methylmalonate-